MHLDARLRHRLINLSRRIVPTLGRTPPPRLYDAGGTFAERYALWAEWSERLQAQARTVTTFNDSVSGPDFLLIVLAKGTVGYPRSLLPEQTYQRWSAVRVDVPAEPSDYDWVVLSARVNELVKFSTAQYISIIDEDCVLSPDCLQHLAAVLTAHDADYIYTDEDDIAPDGRRSNPILKPSWSPTFFLSEPYTGNLSVFRRVTFLAAGGFRGHFGEAMLYDAVLRVTERSDKVYHVPRVLYHATNRVEGSSMGRCQAVAEALERRGVRANIEMDAGGKWEIAWSSALPARVSIIILTRNGGTRLRRCIESLRSNTTHGDLEIVVVNHDSTDPVTIEFLDSAPVRVLSYSGPFNFARMNNMAAATCQSDYLVFLNDDTEILDPGWLPALLGQAQRPHIGVVGARLLYPDGRIQHAGVYTGRGVAQHIFRLLPNEPDLPYYFWTNRAREVAAVTGACMAVRRSVYESLGGMNDTLAVSFNDIDLCLRARKAGLTIIYEPRATLIHHESASRPAVVDQFEVSYMYRHWGEELLDDPYNHPNLRLDCESFPMGVDVPEAVDRVLTYSQAEGVIGPMDRLRPVAQTFRMDRDYLCGVAIQFGTYGCVSRGSIDIEVKALDGDPCSLRTVQVDASAVRDTAYHHVFFDPIHHSASREFSLTIAFKPLTFWDQMTVWRGSMAACGIPVCSVAGRLQYGPICFRVFSLAVDPCQGEYSACRARIEPGIMPEAKSEPTL